VTRDLRRALELFQIASESGLTAGAQSYAEDIRLLVEDEQDEPYTSNELLPR
jgi:hypothetical protein